MKLQVFYHYGDVKAISSERPEIVGSGKNDNEAVGDFFRKAGLVSIEEIRKPAEFADRQMTMKTAP